MASVYENSYMIVLIFLLLGILLPVVALTLGLSLIHISEPTRHLR
ncbi:NADH-quinone oxidoreductase subunit A, partial [Staphylococcus haemolyticus]|nr:NADH-quinone oxidoreductase subunit A [Staphylococcus haemolyticus]